MGGVIQHDRLFQMDDLKVQESRAAADEKHNVAGMLEWLRRHPGFYTSTAYPDWPNATEYPLQEVIGELGIAYYNSTVAYALALAVFEKIPKVSLYGVDFSYPDRHIAEKGRGCVEFLCGFAAARGMQIEVAQDSTLLDANVDPSERFYGYDAWDIAVDGKGITKERRAELPSVAEIEKRYDKGRSDGIRDTA